MYVLNSGLSSQLVASVSQLVEYPYAKEANQDFSPNIAEPRTNFFPFLRRLGAGFSFRIVDDSASDYIDSAEITIDSGAFTSTFHQQIGTYMLHGELLFAVAEFNESAYAKPMPWQSSYNTNYNIELKPLGLFRSFFINGTRGNYENFFDMCPVSKSTSYYSKSRTPNFYAGEELCTETTFSAPDEKHAYEEYRPFVSENLGYSRSYFYGMNR